MKGKKKEIRIGSDVLKGMIAATAAETGIDHVTLKEAFIELSRDIKVCIFSDDFPKVYLKGFGTLKPNIKRLETLLRHLDFEIDRWDPEYFHGKRESRGDVKKLEARRTKLIHAIQRISEETGVMPQYHESRVGKLENKSTI